MYCVPGSILLLLGFFNNLDSQKYDPNYFSPFRTFLYHPVCPVLDSHFLTPFKSLGTRKPKPRENCRKVEISVLRGKEVHNPPLENVLPGYWVNSPLPSFFLSVSEERRRRKTKSLRKSNFRSYTVTRCKTSSYRTWSSLLKVTFSRFF